jgi:hypothetical protein
MKMKHIVIQYLFATDSNKKDRGASLIYAIIFVTFFTSLIYIVATRVNTNSKMNALTICERQAFLLAESGIEFALDYSINHGNWQWSDSINYAGGMVILNVSEANNDTMQIVSTGRYGNTAKQNYLLLYARDLTQYSVYIGGKINGILWGDNNQFKEDQTDFVAMDLDSMKNIAKKQGTYYNGNTTITQNPFASDFWSNPSDHDKDANIIFVENGHLTIKSPNTECNGIFIVKEGNIKFMSTGSVNGIIYLESDNERNVEITGLNFRQINGAVIGNAKIISHARFQVVRNADYINKFYNYAVNPAEVISIERLCWSSIY